MKKEKNRDKNEKRKEPRKNDLKMSLNFFYTTLAQLVEHAHFTYVTVNSNFHSGYVLVAQLVRALVL